MFRAVATPEFGLTFYRIWRFRLKHLKTGLTFEICDWKAAMSSTFSNGCPIDPDFREDALDLLQLLTHRHFIMHPLGLNPRVERSCHFTICASAGGLLKPEGRRGKFRARGRKRKAASSSASSQGLSYNALGKQMYDNCVSEIDERLERWRARRQLALLNNAAHTSLSVDQGSEGRFSRQSSMSSAYSDIDSTTEEESQREK